MPSVEHSLVAAQPSAAVQHSFAVADYPYAAGAEDVVAGAVAGLAVAVGDSVVRGRAQEFAMVFAHQC